MALIEKLVEMRIDTFLKEFDIDISDFSVTNIIRKINWETLKRKFIKYNLVTLSLEGQAGVKAEFSAPADNHNAYDCYLVINNIIWKNIMTWLILDNKLYIHMYHNSCQIVRLICYSYYPYLSYDMLLKKNWCDYDIGVLKGNCSKLQTKIINYIMLLDILVTEYMISDLVYMFKMYIYDVMLEL